MTDQFPAPGRRKLPGAAEVQGRQIDYPAEGRSFLFQVTRLALARPDTRAAGLITAWLNLVRTIWLLRTPAARHDIGEPECVMTAGSPGAVRGSADPDAAIYDRYATNLYRLAFYALGDTGLAEQVLCEVIVAECMRSPARASRPAGDGQRLAIAVYRRCRDLAGGYTSPNDLAGRRPQAGAMPAEPGSPLTGREHDALGLVLFGRLDYRQVAAELRMPPASVARLLLGALRKLTAGQ
jgi:DNA-binding CsgD family transcriptional regulator